jgi:hypothetical protein
MAWRVLNRVAGSAVVTATSTAPVAALADHGTSGLIAAAVVGCIGLLLGALAPDGVFLAVALLSERNQRWRYGRTTEAEKELRERILTFDPYTEMARIRAGVPKDRADAGDRARGSGKSKRRGKASSRRS